MDIRLHDDETRFYIILENPSDEDKVKAMDLVSDIFKIKPNAEKPEGVIATKVEEIVLPVLEPVKNNEGRPGTKYVPKVTSAKQFVEEYLAFNTFDEKNRKWVLIHCSNYMKQYLKEMNVEKMDDIKKFFQDFGSVLENTTSQYLKKNGYSNLKGFLAKAEETEIRSMFEACKSSVCKGLNIK